MAVQTKCKVCRKTVHQHTLRVKAHIRRRNSGKWVYYHLSCWKPQIVNPLSALRNRNPGKNLSSGLDRRWNQQFVSREEQVPVQYLEQAVSIHSSQSLLLEVFAYLPMTDLETRVAYSSKAWFHFTRDTELWKVRYVSSTPRDGRATAGSTCDLGLCVLALSPTPPSGPSLHEMSLLQASSLHRVFSPGRG